jgi:hypothetical protein
MQNYLVAKYVDDIRRNEPVNVGVIVFEGSEVAARFEGEDDHGRLDRRRIRKLVSGRDAYTAWVQHWRRALANATDPESLLEAGSQDFFVERGGTIIMDHDHRAVADTVHDLYARLVKPEDPPAPQSLQDKSQHALRLAGVDLADAAHFQRDAMVEMDVRGQIFSEPLSYAVRNGTWHYLQEISLDPQRPRRSRKEANHCAFLMEHARIDGSRLVLFDSNDIDETTEPMLRLVEAVAPIIDVDDVAEAAAALRPQLGLASQTAAVSST